jgi:uroporphyrinogen III methyltransferase/synthase
MKPGKVWLVGAGPGDPNLITVRGAEVLSTADVVLYDALSHPALLEGCRPDAELRNVGKRGGRQSPSQDWITEQLVELARAGKRVVRLKGGDPLLFARGAEEAEALSRAGIDFEIVPGLSSPATAAAYAGISLTHRDLSSSVTFITGTDREGVDWTPDAWQRLATATDTICVLMGMRKIREIAEAIVRGGRSANTPAAVIQWGARPEQRVLVSTLGAVADDVEKQGFTNPAIIVVGEVVELRQVLRWYDTKPLFGKRILVPRAAEQAKKTAAMIRERGAEPVIFPIIEIHEPPDGAPLARAIGALDVYDWVLFTSVNGVERFFAELARRKKDARAFGAARIGAIGPGTRDALVRHGIVADVMAHEYVGEGLARDVLAEGAKNVLLVRALIARDALPRLLREGGANVSVVPAYETKPASADRAAELRRLFEDGHVDAALFTSSSTVNGLVELLGKEAGSLLARTVVAAIGPVTSATLRERGLEANVAASEYTVVGLLDALEHHFRGSPHLVT